MSSGVPSRPAGVAAVPDERISSVIHPVSTGPGLITLARTPYFAIASAVEVDSHAEQHVQNQPFIGLGGVLRKRRAVGEVHVDVTDLHRTAWHLGAELQHHALLRLHPDHQLVVAQGLYVGVLERQVRGHLEQHRQLGDPPPILSVITDVRFADEPSRGVHARNLTPGWRADNVPGGAIARAQARAEGPRPAPIVRERPTVTFGSRGRNLVAGVFGGLTAKKTIILIQGVPAGIALALVRTGMPLLVIGGLLGIASAEEKPEKAGTFQSTSYGFSLEAPGFPRLSEEEQHATVVAFPASPGRAPSHVNVSVEMRSRYTFERLRDLVKNQHDKSGLHVRDVKELEVSGKKAFLLSSDGPLKGTETTVLELVVHDAPRIHRVRAEARTEDWKRDGELLRASVESFKLDKK